MPIPPASHLALLSTITVHPACTTRADKPDLVDGASHALCYLRSVLEMVGPLHADFRTALQFHKLSRWGGRRATDFTAGGVSSDGSDAESERDDGRIAGALANHGSLWSRGQDFWSVVGWAMNCSVLYPGRWTYWHPWLEFMCDVLEADWHERDRIDREAFEPGDQTEDDAPTTSRQDSIIMMYMGQKNGPQRSYKIIIKALLADGSNLSSTAFPEVFDKEPRGRKKESNKRKRDTLDLENDKFGDYLDDDAISSGPSEPPTPQKPRDRRKAQPFGVTNPGMVESISIRLRLFKLLSLATYKLRLYTELEHLYQDFAASLKLVPLSVFALIVSQRRNPLQPETHITLLKELFYLLLPGSYKNPGKVDPDGSAEGALTRPMMEQCFAIHAANTVAPDDNAKLSLVVESALQLLWTADMLEGDTSSLVRAVEKGIKAREAKVKKKRTAKAKTTDLDDDYSLEILGNSTLRIHQLLELL